MSQGELGVGVDQIRLGTKTDGRRAMLCLLAWRKVPMASCGGLPFCVRWHNTGVEGS